MQASANGTNFTTLWSKPASVADSNAWQTASASISRPYKWLRFNYKVGGGAVNNDLALDNIRVHLGRPTTAPTTSAAPSVTPRPSPMLCTAPVQHKTVAATFEDLSASSQGCGAQVNVSAHLTFTRPITISGRDLTIAGSTATGGIAELTSNRNYSAERGGLFKVTDGSHVIFTRLVFINGISELFGGCVYADGGSTVEFRDTEFWRCSAPLGGGAYIGRRLTPASTTTFQRPLPSPSLPSPSVCRYYDRVHLLPSPPLTFLFPTSTTLRA